MAAPIKPYKYGTEYNYKLVGYRELDSLLRSNVCILNVLRRHPVEGKKAFRRMLCTNSLDFLNSYNGKMKVGYRPPTQAPPYDPKKYNLICAWDIMSMGFRMINMDECYMNYVYPVITKQERYMFWIELFNKTFYLMTPQEKLGWMSIW